jgi:hypothetical protein
MEPTQPNSDEELALIGEVESLELQLMSAGGPINQTLQEMILASIRCKPLTDRIEKRRNRKEQLQTLVSSVLATSAGP